MKFCALILVFMLTPCVWAEPSAKGLEALRREAERSHSDAFLLWQDGKLIVEYYSADGPKKIHAMSGTKSIVSMAIGNLLAHGKLESVDQAVSDFYPEWKQGQKGSVTLRHLMNHTSGIQNVRETAMKEIYPSPDFVQLALAAELDHEPGTHFSYNNKAVNLLSGIVEKVSGRRLDLYVQEELFEPLGIQDVTWELDDAGHAQVMAGLHLFPSDLLRLGRLMLEGGTWHGRTLLRPEWIDESTRRQGETGCGLLWWVISEPKRFVIDEVSLKAFKERVISPEAHQAAASVMGVYPDRESLGKAIKLAFAASHAWKDGEFRHHVDKDLIRAEGFEFRGYCANGYLGQYLLVLPEERVVAVRMVSWSEGYDEKTDGFSNFVSAILKIVDNPTL